MSEIGKSYHMPSFVVDGMSVEAVHYAIEEVAFELEKEKDRHCWILEHIDTRVILCQILKNTEQKMK